MLDVLIALVLLALGFWAGKQAGARKPVPPQPEEQERIRVQEDRAAFSQLMGYSADRAYGRENE